MSKVKSSSIWAGILACGLAACLDLRTPKPEAERPTKAVSDAELLELERLGRGDILEVKVFREPDLNGVYPVGFDGSIVFPLIGKVNVVSRDAQDVADEIRTRLADGYLRDPQVSVVVRERTAQKIHVLGQVEKAGTFGFRTGMSVIEAITHAGGFTSLAAKDSVRVTRVTGEGEHVFEVPAGKIGQGKAPNFSLEPGDIIYVPEAIF